MTPTNSCLGRLDPATISKVDAKGNPVSGGKPTKEAFLHLSVYEQRSSAGAVVHLHSTHSVAVSCLADTDPKQPIPPITAYYVMKIGNLAVARPRRSSAHFLRSPRIRDPAANHGPWLPAGPRPVYATEDWRKRRNRICC
jgi:ribulose-5-phosphate 4-epimerase/fuculose-1-phosphate aldolase